MRRYLGSQEWKYQRYNRLFGVVAVVALASAVIAAFACAGYKRLDAMGWIPHYGEINIDADVMENWAVGDSKDCTSYPLTRHFVQLFGTSLELSAIYDLNCSPDIIYDAEEPPQKDVRITIWGRAEQPEYDWILWRCTRTAESFTCRQTRNSPRALRGIDRATGRPVKSYDGGKSWQWGDL